MKKVILAVICLPVLALAHGSPIEATEAAALKALALFKGESEQVKANFHGIKAWPSGADIFVKVYLSKDNKDALNYSCVMNHASGHDEIECKKN